MMKERMREKLPRDQKESKDRCSELDPFLPSFSSSKSTHSPANCRVPPHPFCIPEKKEVDECTCPSESQHWNSKLVGMETGRWSGSGGRDERREPKCRTYPAHKYSYSTDALDYSQAKRTHCKNSLGIPEPKCRVLADSTQFTFPSFNRLHSWFSRKKRRHPHEMQRLIGGCDVS
jgi:hypothetical protein